MGQRKVTETIKEYDDKGNLVREQITETTENYEEIQYPNIGYPPYNPYNPVIYSDRTSIYPNSIELNKNIDNNFNTIQNQKYKGPTPSRTCDGVPEY